MQDNELAIYYSYICSHGGNLLGFLNYHSSHGGERYELLQRMMNHPYVQFLRNFQMEPEFNYIDRGEIETHFVSLGMDRTRRLSHHLPTNGSQINVHLTIIRRPNNIELNIPGVRNGGVGFLSIEPGSSTTKFLTKPNEYTTALCSGWGDGYNIDTFIPTILDDKGNYCPTEVFWTKGQINTESIP